MKTKLALIGMAALVLAAVLLAAEEARTDRFVVPFSNPAKPGKVEVSLMRGSIKVVGYEGKDVIVEATAREKAPGAKQEQEQAPEPGDQQAKAKAAGMKRIPLENAGLTAEESDNVVTVDVESWRRAMDLSLRVPFNTSLALQAMQNGDILVENVAGEIEVQNLNGAVTLTNVSGTVSASTLNGGVKASLAKVTPDKPMSFSTMSGDLDVTLPAEVKANVTIKCERGEVYSDFDIAPRQVPQMAAEARKKEGGKFRISLDSSFYGAINGGGPEYRFESFTGNVYLRKKK